MPTVIAPVDGFTGTIGGHTFTDGRAEVTDPRIAAWFARRGYTVVEDPADLPAPAEDTTTPEVPVARPSRRKRSRS